MRSISLPLVGLLLFAPSVAASTYIVDDNGGPGVDFVDIASALTAAAPGDVIVVREGAYGGFTLNVGLSIVGEPGAEVIGGIQISGLPAQPRATLTGLATRWITIDQCAGPITLEELSATSGAPLGALTAMITVSNSADVRLRGVDVPYAWVGGFEALLVHSSRVEVTHSVLHGAFGHSHDIYTYASPPQDGGDGISVTGSGSLHISSSVVRGGWGGDLPSLTICGGGCPTAADGGAGIRMGAGTSVLVTGPDFAGIFGGYNGTGDTCGEDGTPGNGIVAHASATLRVSGATVRGGPFVYPCGAAPVAPILGPSVTASPADPTLTISGAVEVQPVTFTVQGEPGSTATLWLGRQLVVVDLDGVVEDQLVVPLRTYDLGTLPASGTATHLLQFSPAWPEGAIFVAQAKTTSVGGAVALTQSMPLTVR